jgi:hypothetical protein
MKKIGSNGIYFSPRNVRSKYHKFWQCNLIKAFVASKRLNKLYIASNVQLVLLKYGASPNLERSKVCVCITVELAL